MIYLFHDYALDTDCFELRHAGMVCKLAPKVFNLLQYLIEHRERVVPREEILEHLWPGQAVTDSSLNHCAMEARKALNDGGETHHTLQTVRHRGYRFIAPVVVQQLLENTPAPMLPLPPALVRGLSVALCGRSQELTSLAEHFAHVQRGHGHAVALVGPPGIGKSRLLQEFYQRYIPPTGSTYIRACCPFYAQLRPFGLVRTVLQQCYGGLEHFTPATLAMQVRQHGAASGLPSHLVPLVLTALWGPTENAVPLDDLDPEVAQEHLTAVLGALILRITQRQPLVLILEDVQWIDASSACWLQWLLEQTVNAPLLLLLSYRPEYQLPWLASFSVERIVLSSLSAADSRRLVHTLLPAHGVAPYVVEEILQNAQGNPLALVLLTHIVYEQPQTATSPVVPGTIMAAFSQCLEPLTPAARRLLHAVAVLDGSWDMPLLAAVWDGAEEVSTLVQELQQGGWQDQSPLRAPYLCEPTILQEMLYGVLDTGERQYWHRRLGHALQAVAGRPQVTLWERLAYHYAAAEDTATAPEALWQAANQAVQQFAYAEALLLLQEALRQEERLPEPQQQWRCRIRFCLAHLLYMEGRHTEALALLSDHDETRASCRNSVSTQERALLLSQLAGALGDWPRASAQAAQALAAIPAHDVVAQGLGYTLRAMASYWREEHMQGAEEAREAVARLAPTARHTALGWAYVVLGLHYLAVGEVQQALEATAMVQTLARPVGNAMLDATGAWMTGAIHALCHRSEAAIAACQRSLELAPEALTTALATGWLGYAFLDHGAVASAVEYLSQASVTLHALSYRRQAGLFTILLGAAYAQQQRFEQAQETVQQGLAIVHASQYGAGIAWAQRVLGQIALAQTEWSMAAQYLQMALAMFTRVSARLEIGRTHLCLGELARYQHDHAMMRWQGQAALDVLRPLQVEAYMTQATHLLQSAS